MQVISFLGLAYAAFGFYNETYLHWIDSVWFSTYSDRIAVLVFGILRVLSEREPYTRKRIAVLTTLVTVLWLILPAVFGISDFNHHTFGTPWFFIYLVIVFLIGRRADCSWNCPCVGIRDTAGEPFRERTLKGRLAWSLRWVKWIILASALPYLYLVVVAPGAWWGRLYIFIFWQVNLNLYFLSLLLVPLTGSRNYCRYLCPWGAMYGLIGRVGFFRIVADPQRCVPCNICEQACDMGVPLRQLIQSRGEIRSADCIGCGRCVLSCPRSALRFSDARDYLPPGFAHVISNGVRNPSALREISRSARNDK